MFSRKAKIKKRPVGSHFSNWSISRRLTTLYAGSSLLLLVLAAAYLYWSLLEDLRQDDAAFLGNEIQECRALLRERPEDTSLLTHEIESEAAGSQFIKYYDRLVDERRQVLRETPCMADLLPPENFPAPVGPEETPSRGKIGKP